MNKTTDPLIEIILEKRVRKRIIEKQRIRQVIQKKSPKPNLRDFRKKGSKL